MQNLALFFTAALFAIAGCYAVWAWWRLGHSVLWLVPGGLSLALFAWTLVNVDFAGRAYAVYGGIYIVSSLLWLWAVEGNRPDRWDMIGAAICLVGAAVVLMAPRSA